jgi:hypothetical protein
MALSSPIVIHVLYGVANIAIDFCTVCCQHPPALPAELLCLKASSDSFVPQPQTLPDCPHANAHHQRSEETLPRGKKNLCWGLNAVGYSWSCRHIVLLVVNPDVEGPTFGDGSSVYRFALVATTRHKLVPATMGLYTCLRFIEVESPFSNDTVSIINVTWEYQSHSKSLYCDRFSFTCGECTLQPRLVITPNGAATQALDQC